MNMFPGFPGGKVSAEFLGNNLVIELSPEDVAKALIAGANENLKKFMSTEVTESHIAIVVRIGDMLKSSVGSSNLPISVDPDTITINVAIDDMIKAFKDKYPNVDVQYVNGKIRLNMPVQPVNQPFKM